MQKAVEMLELNPNNLPDSKTVSSVIKEEYVFIKDILYDRALRTAETQSCWQGIHTIFMATYSYSKSSCTGMVST